MDAAAATDRIKLTTYVLNQDWRPPGLLAQEAATVQLFTENRLELGIGAGWAEPEYIQAGVQFDPASTRVARFDEYLQIVRGLLHATSPFSFAGTYFTLKDYQPLPGGTPPPLLVGGGSPKILATAGRLADIIGISTRATPDSRVDARNITAAEVDKKVAWIRSAAGARFNDIELNMTVREVRVTDDRRAAARQILSEWQQGRMAHADALSESDVLDSPHIAVGTVSHIAEQLELQRSRWGITYFEVSSSVMDTIAPIVERLSRA